MSPRSPPPTSSWPDVQAAEVIAAIRAWDPEQLRDFGKWKPDEPGFKALLGTELVLSDELEEEFEVQA